MGRDVSYSGRLAGRVRGVARRSSEVPGSSVGMPRGGSRFGHPHLSPYPGTRELDRTPRTVVIGPRLLEEGKDMLGAVGRPERQEVVVVIGQAATTTQGDEPRISDLGKDHRRSLRFSFKTSTTQTSKAVTRAPINVGHPPQGTVHAPNIP